ncbi:hypothetical protein ACJZ2D_009708 [Fusarium nematophilum]
MSYGTIKTSATKPNVSETSPLLTQDDANGNPASASASASEDGSSSETSQRDATCWASLKAIYFRNIGLFLVFLAQMFGSIVSAHKGPGRCSMGALTKADVHDNSAVGNGV